MPRRLATLASLSLLAGTTPPPLTGQDARLQAVLDSVRPAIGAPGASAALILPDGREWTGASGVAWGSEPASPQTAFDLGSVTKTYTAALVLLLFSEGKLALGDTLGRWFPNAPGAAATVGQLLTHMSGLPDPFDNPDWVPRVLSGPARRWQPEETLSLMDSLAVPGSGWSYSSGGYLLLGRLAERVAGDSLVRLLRTRLFRPRGLDGTWFAPDEPVGAPHAHPFLDINGDGTPEDLGALIPMTAFRSSAWAAGGMAATAGDAARWMRALVGGRVLPPRAQQALLRLVDRPDGLQHGHGVLVLTLDGERGVGHKGNAAGFSAAVFHLPARDVTVALLTNAHLVDVTPGAAALVRAAR